MSDLLRVEGLQIAFTVHGHAIEAVKGVSFRVRPGSVVAIVGESGSGKSVTAQAIMGILPHVGDITAGRILFADPAGNGAAVDIAALPRDSDAMRALRGSRMTMIFQEPMSSLSPLHTIGNQVAEALTTHIPAARGTARAQSEETLALVGFPDPKRAFDMYPFELSGGLRQRAMIAMAVICRPALLVADEPTTALDVTIQAQVLNLLKSLQSRFGMAMLLITHDLGVVANMADEIVVMYGGEVMEAGPAGAIFRRPAHPYLKALLKAVPHFDMEPGERLVSLRDARGDGPVVSRPLEPRSAVASGEILLAVRDIRKAFTTQKGSWFGKSEERKTYAVNGVSFDIKRGECLGLVGESGCGKTTVSKIIMRALTPDSGSVVFRDGTAEIDLAKLEGRALTDFRTRIQMVFQDPVSSLSPRMTVLNILREPLQIHGRGNRREQVERAAESMRAVGLDPRFLNRYPHSFSGGQRQRIGIA
ncbi:MAG: ATP-binding cassette domain-containing protein, partial [Hyphomicrobiaceae bacterium]